MTTDLALPTPRELEALSPADRWNIEDAIGEAQGLLREFNDDELRRWVEVEHKTQAEIAKVVGRSQGRISRRCAALGIASGRTNSGQKRSMPPHTSEEIIDAEVVDDDPPPKARRKPSPDGPAHHFPDVVAEDADQNLRTQALHWFEQGREVKELLDKRQPLESRSGEDRKVIKREAAVMERVARRLKEAANA